MDAEREGGGDPGGGLRRVLEFGEDHGWALGAAAARNGERAHLPEAARGVLVESQRVS